MAIAEPPPLIAPIAEGRRELLDSAWQRWFLDVVAPTLDNTPTLIGAPINRTNQSASIGITNILLPSLIAGDYLFIYYARITTIDPVSSSLTVTLRWTEGAVSLSLSGAAMTGNTVTTVQSGVVPVYVDGATPLAYSTTYVSNTPGAMRYTLRVKVQSLQGAQ